MKQLATRMIILLPAVVIPIEAVLEDENDIYVDGDMVPYKFRNKIGDIETSWVARSREEAMRAPDKQERQS